MIAIVTTTINSPTKATLKYRDIAHKNNWTFIIVGDTKTNHDEYKQLESSNVIYLSPEIQERLYPKISNVIGWKTIQRRNIGFIHAYKLGADIIATVDDDNIPYDNWGENILVGKTVEVDLYTPQNAIVFDPLSITSQKHLWHRGYPIEYVPSRHLVSYVGTERRRVLIQADLWDGDPDIDALTRLEYKPLVKFEQFRRPYAGTTVSPFNSQNTFIDRSVFPHYSVYPNVGRMDDIWSSYVAQLHFPNSLIYNNASVYQERNVQDLITNLEKEVIGYRNTLKIVNSVYTKNTVGIESVLPAGTVNFLNVYKTYFNT